MNILNTSNLASNTVQSAAYSAEAIEAQTHWLATGLVPKDYVVSVLGRSYTTVDSPFGLSISSPEKIDALLAGIESARTGRTIDLGSFACFAEDDADEG